MDRCLDCPEVCTGLADGRNLWQVVCPVGGGPRRLRCLDLSSGETLRELAFEPDNRDACGIDVVGDAFWVGREGVATLELRSLEDGRLLRQFRAKPRIAGVTWAGGTVWYTEAVQALLVQVDPESGRTLAEYAVGGMPTGLTWDGELFWFNDYEAKRVKGVRTGEAGVH